MGVSAAIYSNVQNVMISQHAIYLSIFILCFMIIVIIRLHYDEQGCVIQLRYILCNIGHSEVGTALHTYNKLQDVLQWLVYDNFQL